MEEILASIRKIIADEKEPESASDSAPADEVLELTQLVQDDGSVVDLAHGEPPKPIDIINETQPQFTPPPQFQQPPAYAPPPQAEYRQPPRQQPMGVPEYEIGDDLLSSYSASAASSALSSLANAVNSERMAAGMPAMGTAINGSKTLEQIVVEIMRPMLKVWLDANLPHIVERIVQREVERIGRKISD